jgi:bacitracin synthase 3
MDTRKLDKKDVREIYPLSPVQQGLLFHYINGSSDLYFEQISVRINGVFEYDRFLAAWETVAHNHELLRAVFRWKELSAPVIIVLNRKQPVVRYFDLSENESTGASLEDIKERDRSEGFDLEQNTFRVTLVKLGETAYEFILSNHHILLDGWSTMLLLKEVLNACKSGDEHLSSGMANGAFKHILMQYLQQYNDNNSHEYWKNYLKDREHGGLSGFRRSVTPGGRIRHLKYTLDQSLRQELIVLGKKHRVSPAAVYYCAWGLLLQRYKYCEDVLFDITLSGRSATITGIEKVLGLFINTVPLRIKSRANDRIIDALQRVQEDIINAGEQQFLNTQNGAFLESEPFRRSVNSLVVFENYPVDFNLNDSPMGFTIGGITFNETTRYDITVVISAFDGLNIDISYNTARFDTDLINALMDGYLQVISHFGKDVNTSFAGLAIDPSTLGILKRDAERTVLNSMREKEMADGQLAFENTKHNECTTEPEKKLQEYCSELFNVPAGMIHADANWFELGANSISMTQLMARVSRDFKVPVRFSTIIKYDTIRAFAEYITTARTEEVKAVSEATAREFYELTPQEEGIYLHHNINGDPLSYHVIRGFGITGELDADKLEAVLNIILNRHEAFRTGFVQTEGAIRKTIKQSVVLRLERKTLSAGVQPEHDSDLKAPFDLAEAPLCRGILFNTGEHEYVLLIAMHHIICDGFSVDILIRELISALKDEALEALSLKYIDYTEYERAFKNTAAYKIQEDYWLGRFNNSAYRFDDIFKRFRTGDDALTVGTATRSFDKDITDKLRQFLRGQKASLFEFYLAAFSILLSKMTGHEDILLAAPVARRNRQELNNVVGLLLNNLLLQHTVRYNDRFIDLLEAVKNNFHHALDHQDYPFYELIKRLKINKDFERVVNVWINAPDATDLQHQEFTFNNCSIKPYPLNVASGDRDMELYIYEQAKVLTVRLQYRASLFNASTINYLLDEFVLLIRSVLADPETMIRDLDVFSVKRIQPDGTRKDNSAGGSVKDIFEQIVNRYPDRIAVKQSRIEYITYAELNRKANKVAWEIMGTGAANAPVAIYLGHNMEMVSSMLAVLKSGNFYVPLDVHYPYGRMAVILRDSGAKIVLTDKQGNLKLQELLSTYAVEHVRVICIGDTERQPSENPEADIRPESKSYILYTSGSTGVPKGIVQSHAGLLHHIDVYTKYLQVSKEDKLTLFSSFTHDASLMDIFSALLNGATLYPIDVKEAGSYGKVIDFMRQEGITIYHSVPTLYRILVRELEDAAQIGSLRFVVLGGEPVLASDLQKYKACFSSHCRFVNLFGQSEASIAFMSCYDSGDLPLQRILPLGSPVNGTKVYLLNEQRQEAAVFETGELVYESPGLFKGYLNRPELTNACFDHAGSLFFTGDLGRRLPNGSIEFTGRKDARIKLNGYRIEPAEIESVISEVGGIIQCAVTCVYDGDTNNAMLAAYYVADKELIQEEIKSIISERLPGYMIPAVFVRLQHLPVTGTGKTDRSALPQNLPLPVSAKRDPVKPINDCEQELVVIWSHILGISVNDINTTDSFYSLGGDSLKAINLLYLLKKKYHAAISLNRFFKTSDIRSIASLISEKNDSGALSVESLPVAVPDTGRMYEPFPLTKVQMAYLLGRETVYDIGGFSTHSYIEIITALDHNKLEHCLNRLIGKHPALRTIITTDGLQHVLKGELHYRIVYEDLSGLAEEEKSQRLMDERKRMESHVFELSSWPLFELKAYRLSAAEMLVAFSLGLITADAHSVHMLASELLELYNAPEQELHAAEFTFRDYVLALEKFRESALYEQSKLYWQKKLDDFPPAPMIPLKQKSRGAVKPVFRRKQCVLSKEEWQQLKTIAQANGITPSILCCTAYATVLSFWSNQPELALNLTLYNRLPFHKDVDKIMGAFTSLLILPVAIERRSSLVENAIRVQQVFYDSLEHKYYDGVDFIGDIRKRSNITTEAVMPVVFTSALYEDTDAYFWESYGNIKYQITRTPQVYLDHQLWLKNHELVLTWDYAEELIAADTIHNMFEQYIGLLHQTLGLTPAALPGLTAEDRKLVETYNATEKIFKMMTLGELISRAAVSDGNKIAIEHEGQFISYRELNNRAVQVAHYLMSNGVGHKDYVGISGEKCINTIINILGVLKAGAVYVPVEPGNPPERKEYIYSNSNCKVLLEKDSYEKNRMHEMPLTDISVAASMDDIAYVIYTSGTTGRPKGVVITHRAAINTILDISERFNITAEDRILCVSSLGFDLSVYDIFGAFHLGATLVLHADTTDVDGIRNCLKEQRITVWNSVPAILDLVVKSSRADEVNYSLNKILLSGDWIPLNLPKKLNHFFPAAAIYSLGGATEASIWSIWFPITNVDLSWKSIPYGYPLANQQIYILDSCFDICPVEVKGEIYIGGIGVALGYMNAADITAASFIQHPVLGRIYRTGDYGILKREGYVEFLGRKDFQVKISGYRIELQEIENKLLAINGIKSALVITRERENRDKYLCAYLIAEEDLEARYLSQFLKERLPAYMIPSHFVFLKQFPVSPNGKIDRKALPVPEERAGEFVRATSALENKLLAVWEEVLEAESGSIGVTDGFFESGGTSLTAILLLSKIRSGLKLELGIRKLFELQTIRSIAVFLEQQETLSYYSIPAATCKDHYNLSFQQKRLYFLFEFDRTSLAYNMPQVVKIKGTINKERLQAAFRKLLDRHESLRTAIDMREDLPVQRIEKDTVFEIAEYSVTEPAEVSQIITAFIRPFDLSKPGLIRVALISCINSEHILIVDTHHIISDGFSQQILIKDFIALYKNVQLPDLRLQYKDYSEWQGNPVYQQDVQKQKQFWIDQFNKLPAPLELPVDFARPAVRTQRGDKIFFDLCATDTLKLKRLAEDNGASVFMIMLSVYSVFLSKITDGEDIVIGTPVIGRHHADLNNIVGMFVNTLAIRTFPGAGTGFHELLLQIRSCVLTALENQLFQYESLIDELAIERDPGRNPLFDVFFSFIDYDNSTIELPGLTLEPYNSKHIISKFDLTLSAFEHNDQLHCSFEFSTDLFEKETIERFISWFKQIVSAVVAEPHATIGAIDMLSNEERNRVLYEFNNTEVKYSQTATVIDLFEEQVKRTPGNIALSCNNTTLTYLEFGSRVNEMAGVLVANGCRPGDVVGIIAERSLEMVTGMYAILKAGAAYMPVDPGYPQERIAYMLRDSNVRLLLSPVEREPISDPLVKLIAWNDAENWPACTPVTVSKAKPEELAYIIYTSGSTGNPKGVMIAHKQVTNILYCLDRLYPLYEKDAYLLKTACVFDVSVTELFGWFFHGGRLVIAEPGREKDAYEMIDAIRSHKITHLNFVPSLFNGFVDVLDEELARQLESVKYIFLAGEAVNPVAVNNFRKLNTRVLLENIYGPTEGTIYTTKYSFSEVIPQQVPIGKPLDNVNVFVLGNYGELKGIGCRGELYIAGDGVSKGYINNERLTGERFVQHPFKAGQQVYRTGDLGRWLPDGNIAFMGRIDEQVKLRGYRIEPGEIAHHLSGCQGISAVHVGVKERNGNPYLIAWYTGSENVDREVLRSYLKERLPEYMIPWWFMRLEQMPLTSNGKIDRKQLPDPPPAGNILYVAPATEIEQKLMQVWSDVLGLPQEQISTNASFFELGGDSIKSIQLVSRIRKSGYSISVQDIFNHTTIKRISAVLKPLEISIAQEAVEGPVQLSPVQEWFFSKRLSSAHHYNQSVMLYFREGISLDDVLSIFSRLQDHHDALRMRYRFNGAVVVQENGGINNPLSIIERDIRGVANAEPLLEDCCNEIQSGISLEKGPLMKLGLFHRDEGSHLLIVIHHLVVDGVSWRILMEDFDTLYRLHKGASVQGLPLKTHSYQWWTEQVNQYTSAEAFKAACAYWSDFTGPGAACLTRDFPLGINTSAECVTASILFSESETQQLLREVPQLCRTQLQDLLLGALSLTFYRLYGFSQLQVDVEGHGREEVIKGAEISRTVGWFTSIYPVLLPCEKDPAHCIRSVKSALRQVPNKGFDYLLYKNGMSNSFPANVPDSAISFNYLGQFDTDISGRGYELSAYPVGALHGLDNERFYDWDILGIVTSGRLRISLSYSRKQYRHDRIAAFLSAYETSLQDLLSYCMSGDVMSSLLTPWDLTYKDLSISELEGLQRNYRIRDIYPLSPMQEGMLFHTLLSPSSGQYFEQLSYGLSGALEVSMVKWSLDYLMTRYDILRTQFIRGVHARNLQVVLDERSSEFTYKDLREEIAQSEISVIVEGYRLADRRRGFHVESDVLMRVMLLRTGESDYEFIWSFHHLLMDGWCLSILVKEFNYIYSCKQAGKAVMLPAAPAYVAYIKWLNQRDEEPSRAYWKDYLAGYNTQSALPKRAGLVEAVEVRAERDHYLRLSAEETIGLQRLANMHGVTLNTLMQVLWGVLLSRYTGQEDVLFGAVVSGRPAEIAGVASMVGLFINTVPVRMRIGKQEKLGALLKSVQAASVASLPHHYSPLAEVQGLSELGRGLLDHILVFENYLITKDVMDNEEENKWKVANYNIYEQTNYGLTLIIVPGSRLAFKFKYDHHIYEPWLIEQCSRHLYNAITGVLHKDVVFVEDIDLLSGEEKEKLLYRFNDTVVEYPSGKTLMHLFDEQVQRTPNNIALVFKGESLTYEAFSDKADKLARFLIKKGTKPDDVIGIIAMRSIEMMIGIYGILKAGAAYLPIDLDYPKERIEHIVNDSKVTLILSPRDNLHFEANDLETVFLTDEQIYRRHERGELRKIHEGNLAYVLYTSGSTGKPKGVMIEHKQVVNTLYCLDRLYPLFEQDAHMLKTSCVFDFSVPELFGWFFHGGRVVILEPGKEKEPAEILALIKAEKISHVNLVPSLFNIVAAMLQDERSADIDGLRYIFLAGEAVNANAVQLFRQINKDIRIENLYGTTEAGIFTTYYSLNDYEVKQPVPIGKPLDNMSVFILDARDNLQGIGIPGELCVSGEGLGRGYINNDMLTAQKFVPNPFLNGQKMYRTGDLARWLPDGNIEFLGRMDHQVKIRGYRIELDEITGQLLNHPDIRNAVVIAIEKEGEKFLSAYYVSDIQLQETEIRNYLTGLLPEYMVPSCFIQLHTIPLTPNGKVDRKALPETGNISIGEFVVPAGVVEERLAELWSSVLAINRNTISATADFFRTGGNSLKAMSLVFRIHKTFDVKIQVGDVFRYRTIVDLATYIRKCEKELFLAIETAGEKEYYRVSSAQKRLYFLHELDRSSMAYNVTLCVKLDGNVDKRRVLEAFRTIIERHAVLRTGFTMRGEVPVQLILAKVDFDIEEYRLHEEPVTEIIRQFVRPFDLAAPPLIRVGLIRISELLHLLMVDVHHIASDGISQQILMKEFCSLYAGDTLPHLKLAYKDYAEWQVSKTQLPAIAEQKEYWKRAFAELPPPLELNTDFPRPAVRDFKGGSVTFEIDTATTAQIKALAGKNGASVFATMLAFFNVLLYRLSNQEDIIIGTVTAGRQHYDLESVIGMFVNTLALRNYPRAHTRFNDFLNDVKSRAIASFDNQLLQYEELISELDLKRDQTRNPLFDVVFSYSNIEEPVFSVPGMRWSTFHYENNVSKFDLLLLAREQSGKISCAFEYATALFSEDTIIRITGYFNTIINSLIADPHQALFEVDMLLPEEKARIMGLLDRTAIPYPEQKTVAGLFEEQVRKTPDNIAIVYEKETITYAELNNRANKVARYLRTAGIHNNSIVGLLLPRSIDLVVAILGIVKAGGAYLPLDPDYPAERTRYMIHDSGAFIVLCNENTIHFRCDGVTMVPLDTIEVANGAMTDEIIISRPSDICYIIYTSGTTGFPKGAMIEHRNVVRLFFNDEFQFSFNAADVWTMFHSQCFDFSVWEIFGALLFGGKLIVLPKSVTRDPALFWEIIYREKVTVLNQTPSSFYNLANVAVSDRRSVAIRYVIFGGEALMPVKLREWHDVYPGVQLVNMFGITETTVHVTYKEIGKAEIEDNISNIGLPIPTLSVYVLNDHLKLVPPGTIGELYVGGCGLARGYLNKPLITAGKFIPNPFKPGEWLYSSGDLGRLLPNGELEYLGRKDEQVQLRGFRIELGEIESRMNMLEGIDRCVVMAKGQAADKVLIAYYVSLKDYTPAKLRTCLLQYLPEYMVPAYFIELESVPLTVNGKVDRRLLPDPDVLPGEDYAPPVNEIEKHLAEIWSEVLKVPVIGRKDNFFSIGGDSMKAVVLVAKINSSLQTQLRVHDIFIYQSVEELAAIIMEEDKKAVVVIREEVEQQLLQLKQKVLNEELPIDKDNIEDIYPMSDIQKGMVYHGLKSPGVYHDQMLHFVKDESFKLQHLKKALEVMTRKHAILRTGFWFLDTDNPLQIVFRESDVPLDFVDLSGKEKTEQAIIIAGLLQKDKELSFEFTRPGIWRFIVFGLGNDIYLLCFICHHAIIDGWSDAAFNTELNNLYLGFKSGAEAEPELLAGSYRDFIAEQLAMLKSVEYKEYWKRELDGYIRYKFPDKEIKSSRERAVDKIEDRVVQEVLSLSKQNGISLRSLCFSAFLYTLKVFSYEDDITIGMTTHNRPNVKDGDKILGCFLNTVPFRIVIPQDTTWRQWVNTVNDKLVGQKRYEVIPFTKIVESAAVKTPDDKNPITDIAFNLLDFYIYDDLQRSQSIQLESPELKELSEKVRTGINVTPNTYFDFLVVRSGREISITLLYDTAFISKRNAADFLHTYNSMLQVMAGNFDGPVDLSTMQKINHMRKKIKIDTTGMELPFNF